MPEKEKISDQVLIQQFINGDRSVFAELVRRYHKIFCEKAYWMTRDKIMAKDVAQDSWIVILDKLPSLKNVNSFQSWSSRILYTKAIDAINHRKRSESNLTSISYLTPDDPDLEEHHRDVRERLLKGIHKLPQAKQDVLRLFYRENYTLHEISELLQIPVGTVKSRLFTAREKLKKFIKNQT